MTITDIIQKVIFLQPDQEDIALPLLEDLDIESCSTKNVDQFFELCQAKEFNKCNRSILKILVKHPSISRRVYNSLYAAFEADVSKYKFFYNKAIKNLNSAEVLRLLISMKEYSLRNSHVEVFLELVKIDNSIDSRTSNSWSLNLNDNDSLDAFLFQWADIDDLDFSFQKTLGRKFGHIWSSLSTENALKNKHCTPYIDLAAKYSGSPIYQIQNAIVSGEDEDSIVNMINTSFKRKQTGSEFTNFYHWLMGINLFAAAIAMFNRLTIKSARAVGDSTGVWAFMVGGPAVLAQALKAYSKRGLTYEERWYDNQFKDSIRYDEMEKAQFIFDHFPDKLEKFGSYEINDFFSAIPRANSEKLAFYVRMFQDVGVNIKADVLSNNHYFTRLTPALRARPEIFAFFNSPEIAAVVLKNNIKHFEPYIDVRIFSEEHVEDLL